jgi:nicotinate-nucleotide--dimethylbenzimidazole phosphoribosyltransferase
MSVQRSLIAPTGNSVLEKGLQEKLRRRHDLGGSLGELEPLAARLGLIQGTLNPRIHLPQLLVFAGDHGIAVDGISHAPPGSTARLVQQLVARQVPLGVFAATNGMDLSVVDSGVADPVAPHARLLARKIAHGTRNARVTSAMSLEQAHAAIRAGMEISDALPGNLVAFAGVGVGTHETAAAIIARLTGTELRALLNPGPQGSTEELAHHLLVLQNALSRHRDMQDPVEVLAALGGFEIAMMVGAMLVAASKRHVVVADGIAACAAVVVAARIAAAVTDYCLYTRSRRHPGLDAAFTPLQGGALLELGLDSIDGTGAALALPLIRSAAALLSDAPDGEDAGPSVPAALDSDTTPQKRP